MEKSAPVSTEDSASMDVEASGGDERPGVEGGRVADVQDVDEKEMVVLEVEEKEVVEVEVEEKEVAEVKEDEVKVDAPSSTSTAGTGLRRSERSRRPVIRADGVPEDTLEELEQSGWDMSDRVQPRQREVYWTPISVVDCTVMDHRLYYLFSWVDYSGLTWEPAEDMAHLQVVQDFWQNYWMKSQDALRRLQGTSQS